MVHRRGKPVLHGPNSTESNLFHHVETTYKVGLMSENPTLVLESKELWISGEPRRNKRRGRVTTQSRGPPALFALAPIKRSGWSRGFQTEMFCNSLEDLGYTLFENDRNQN